MSQFDLVVYSQGYVHRNEGTLKFQSMPINEKASFALTVFSLVRKI